LKKIVFKSFLIFMVLLSIMPMSVFAYTGTGQYAGKNVLTGNIATTTVIPGFDQNAKVTNQANFIDGSTATSGTIMQSEIKYTLTNVSDVGALFISMVNLGSSNLSFRLYDASDAIVLEKRVNDLTNAATLTSTGGYEPINLRGIKAISINDYSTETYTVNELDAYDTMPPTDVSGIAIPPANITNTQMRVDFTTPTNTDFDKYKVYKNGVLLETSAAGTAKNTLFQRTYTGLTASTSYTWKVTGIDKYGNESPGASVTASTKAPPDTTPPANVTNLTWTPDSYTTGTLNWTPPADADLNGFNVYQGATKLNGTLLTKTTTSFAISGLTESTSYTWKIISVDATGNENNGSTVTGQGLLHDLTPPANVTNLTWTPNSYTTGTLNWTPPADADLNGFNVYQGATKLNGTLLTKTTTSFAITGLTDNTSYTWKIIAVDATGNANSGSTVTGQGLFHDFIPPDTPTGLQGTASSGSVTLNWNASTAPDVANYRIYLNGSYLGQTGSGAHTFTTAATDNVNNKWEVTAVDTSGNESPKSTPVITYMDTISPLAPIGLAVAGSGPNSVSLTWQPNTEPDLAGYSVFQDLAKITQSLLTATSYTVNGLTAGTTYTFQVTATDTSGNESAKSSAITFIKQLPPTVPTNLKAVSSSHQVSLSWNPVATATKYIIYRNGTKIGEASSGSFSDTTGTSGAQYTYEVTAYNIAGESPKASTNATVSESVKFNENLPFNVMDMLGTSVGFLGIYGKWILIVLGIIFCPLLLAIVSSLMGFDQKKPVRTPRDTQKIRKALGMDTPEYAASKVREAEQVKQHNKWVKEQAEKQREHREDTRKKIMAQPTRERADRAFSRKGLDDYIKAKGYSISSKRQEEIYQSGREAQRLEQRSERFNSRSRRK
jgi:chitodextrinase